MISLFIEALAEGRTPAIHGDGKQTRDFTYVARRRRRRAARAATAPNVAGEVINVAAGGRISLLELVRALQVITQQAHRAGVRSAARG